tara:strand:- start:660 stop:2054 length:1395 start_codon:yes stop_codon:yes gene_type:complete
MPNINDRIGSQNVIRVLSNASAPPTRLVNLSDVDSTLKTRDGMILVWDLGTETFFMTDSIDSSTLNIAGIVTFSSTENSTTTANGALIVNGGIGVGKKVNIGEGLTVAGVSTFASNLDINAAVDILNGLNVQEELDVGGTFKSVGITTLASSGGITTTGGDLYIGGDLYVSDDLVLDEITARNATLSGNLSVDGHTELDDVNIAGVTTTGGLLDINSGGQANTFKVEDLTNNRIVIAGTGGELEDNANLTFDGNKLDIGVNLEVTGVSTFTGVIDANGNLDVDGHTELDDVNVSGVTTTSGLLDINAGAQANTLKVEDLTDNRVIIAGTGGELEDDANLTFNGTQLSVGVNLDVDGHTELDNLNVSGVSTFVGNASFANNVSIAGTLTYEDVTNVDAIGLITARSGLEAGFPGAASTLTSGGDLTLSRDLHVAGLSTFVGIGTFSNDVFVAGTLTAGLIDGGSF